MKGISQYIHEKLFIKKGKNKNNPSYKYFPETKEELKERMKQLIKDRGNEGDFNDIDTSRITDMSYLFDIQGGSDFNGNISEWNVSNVTNMESMFVNCRKFNGNLDLWDVLNVENMKGMFSECKLFEGNGLNNWDVSNVINMHGMFRGCKSFNQSLNGWNVSRVKYIQYMFYGCESFNKPLNNWDVSNVTYMDRMFCYCEKFNQDISKWDVSNVEDMSWMFSECKNFNSDLSNWDVSQVKKFNDMFKSCYSLIGDWLNKWNPKNATNMNYMFYNCKKLNCNISNWHCPKCNNRDCIFINTPLKTKRARHPKWK